ncbi:MAG: site-specific integrase [Alphaproteobacteria bacterium]|nr:site-specific integrase [Alphaproteobacteria bacterium]
MFTKCKTKCQADKNLWIRNNVFYFMVEIPRKNGKRRYFCKSLHTTNYYEAQERAKIMVKSLNSNNIEAKTYIHLAQTVINKLKFDEFDEKVDVGGQTIIQHQKSLSQQNDPETVQELVNIASKLSAITQSTLDDDDIKKITEIVNIAVAAQLQNMVKSGNFKPKTAPGSNYTIEYIVDSMLKKANNTKDVATKRYNRINNLLNGVGLKLTDNYSKFYTAEIIQKMCDNIKALNVKGSVKRTYTREIKNIIMHAHNLDPDTYKTNLINVIPEFKKTSKDEIDPHWPYSDDELKQIFNPANDYFKKNPDVFWTTLIGLFVGARCNAAITLQYADIINVDGIDCIKFQDTHPIKQLKNAATHRTVPIPLQLLNLGFVDYVKRQQAKSNAQPTDFIFPKCQTSSGQYNNKFTTRGFIKYINDIGITKNNPHKLDFHSLRKNANLCLESKAVPETFINDIIGWEGRSTRQQSYSNHDLQKIKVQADKLCYDFLQPEFDQWKIIMVNK